MGIKINYSQSSGTLTGIQASSEPRFIVDRLPQLGRAYLREIDNQFSLSVDPYGQQWIPSKKKRGKTLIKTTTLRRSFSATTFGSSLLIGVGGPAQQYASFHQYGTKNIPKRQIIPTSTQGLPANWIAIAQKILTE